MSLTVYRKQLKLGGGATALDGIDGAILLNLDECTVYQSGIAYTYILNATSGAADDGINTIAPDTNPGTKRWILQGVRTASGAFQDLTASLGVLTDANKKLVSDVAATGSGAPVRANSPALVTPTRTTAPADNDSSLALATTAFAKSQDAVLHREPDQGVALTAAASGGGIMVADNDNIDFGTGNFTLVWKGSLPDWTITDAGGAYLSEKYAAGYGHSLLVAGASQGTLRLVIYEAGASKNMSSSIATGIIDGTEAEIVAVVTRGAINTTTDFYVNGVVLGTQASVATIATCSNTGVLAFQGTLGVRTAGTCIHAYTLNFAPTAAEVLDMYRNGIPESWKWGSQTALYTSNFSAGVDGWDIVTAGSITNNASKLRLTHSTGSNGIKRDTSPSFSNTKRWRLTFKHQLISGVAADFYIRGQNGFFTAISGNLGFLPTSTETIHTVEFSSTSNNDVFYFSAPGNGAVYDFSDFTVTEIGATLALTPENIDSSLQWKDASSNKLHALLPIAGASITRPSNVFVIKWTNTWAGSHEAQYVGGANQNILPAGNIRIESITMTGATGANIVLGDGSDVDHFVASVAMAAYLDCTVASRNHDGTNMKLVIDPDGNVTGSVITTIKGIILG